MTKRSNFPVKSFKLAVIFTAILFFVEGCNDSPVEVPIHQGGTLLTTVSGIVLNENKEPVSGAIVTVHGHTKQTGSGGEFIFNDVSVPGERLFVNVTAAGYFNATRGEIPRSGNVTQVKIILLNKTITHTVNSVSGGSADLTNGSKVEILPNSVVTQNGVPYSGSVNMSVVYMDPTTATFTETVQGGDMAALRSDSTDATLYSFGILKVVLEGSSGEPLQILSGSSSTITTTIPPSMVSSAPSSIPLWYFDESVGLWREDGSAVKQGDKYVGTVSHFTDWNCDTPGSTGRIQGRVRDCNGQPLSGLTLKVGQGTTMTDINGNYSRNVPGGITFDVSIEASQNFGISGGPIPVGPIPAGSTENLADINLGCFPVITGIFRDCSNNPVTGMVSGKWDNQIHTSVPTGDQGFRMTVAPNKTAQIRFISSSGVVKDTIIQTPQTAVTLDLGSISICGQVTQGENSFIINGAGFNNLYVNINATAAYGFYYVNNQETAVSAVNQPGDVIAFFFPGNVKGNFTGQNGYISYQGVILNASKTLNVSVTMYEGVGGIIKGTFNGTFESTQGNADITNGKFFVIRQPDQN